MADEIPYSDNSEPTLVSAEAHKALVDRVNVLSSMRVLGGTFKVSDSNAVLSIDAKAGSGGDVGTSTTTFMKLESGGIALYSVYYEP